jgi:3-deoxy-D-manno-octulosonate 8-phosphate phosphatase (KDO 8-P phosphatase)
LSDRNKAIDKAASVRLAVFDVDGVMTDGRLIYTGNGEQKIFHVQDGLGLKLLKSSGCEVAVISSRSSSLVHERMLELGIGLILQGQKDKRAALLALMVDQGVERRHVAYTGDDLVDLPALRIAGLAIAVANAHPMVKSHADWTTDRPGGSGAVREICELILSSQGNLDSVLKKYLV